jgi:predicted ATPase
MIRQIHIENFKSIEKLTIDLGRINVFIGENGCGKSNILEGIAFGTAASRGMLDNEFLVSRGIRVTEPQFMRAAFREDAEEGEIRIGWKSEGEGDFSCALRSAGSGTQKRWVDILTEAKAEKLLQEVVGMQHDELVAAVGLMSPEDKERIAAKAMPLLERLQRILNKLQANSFLIYAPENSALRNFQAEGQILPLGSKGEGLFAHLRALAGAENRAHFDEIVKSLSLIDWFDHFDLPANLSPGERTIHIRDRYLAEGALFDQRSANEGFLFLLFYFTLFISPDTPSFFAIDNVDTSLNPKLCAELLKHLSRLAAEHGKQAILTTHNPAVLDGLDLHDDMQRLFVIHRASRGPTKARRILPPKPIGDAPPMKLSAAFLAGHIGGLPKNF